MTRVQGWWFIFVLVVNVVLSIHTDGLLALLPSRFIGSHIHIQAISDLYIRCFLSHSFSYFPEVKSTPPQRIACAWIRGVNGRSGDAGNAATPNLEERDLFIPRLVRVGWKEGRFGWWAAAMAQRGAEPAREGREDQAHQLSGNQNGLQEMLVLLGTLELAGEKARQTWMRKWKEAGYVYTYLYQHLSRLQSRCMFADQKRERLWRTVWELKRHYFAWLDAVRQKSKNLNVKMYSEKSGLRMWVYKVGVVVWLYSEVIDLSSAISPT